jgi:hypothetical protein
MDESARPIARRASNSYDLSSLRYPNTRHVAQTRASIPPGQPIWNDVSQMPLNSSEPLPYESQGRRNSQPLSDSSTFVVSPVTPISPGTGIRRKPLSGQYAPLPGEEAAEFSSRPNPISMASYSTAASQESRFSSTSHQTAERLLGPSGRDVGAYQPSHIPDTPPLSYLSSVWSRMTGWISTAFLMMFFYAVGIITAVSHHTFYRSLEGKEAFDQLKMLRYGGIFAYLTKASFVAAVLLAYRQQIWATFRRRDLSITAIDCIFAAADDLGAMFNLEFMRSAKTAISLAFLIW